MGSENQPFIGKHGSGFVTADVHSPEGAGLEAMDFNIKAVAYHHAFKVRDGVFVSRVTVTDPTIEVAHRPAV